jgi:hypothetical protein
VLSTDSYTYSVYGLNVNCSFPCPELLSNNPIPDVYVRYGEVPASLPEAKIKGVCYQAAPNRVLMTTTGIVKYLIEDGQNITIQRSPTSEEKFVRLFLHSALGILLHQRKLLALRGSAVEVNGKAIIFLGYSGQGKTTLSWLLHKRGHALLSDGICALSISEEGKPVVHSGPPYFQLWADTLRAFEEDFSSLSRVRTGLNKYMLPIQTSINKSAIPVSSIYLVNELVSSGDQFAPLSGMEKFNTIKEQTYFRQYIPGMGLDSEHFKLCSIVAKHVPIKKLYRPYGFSNLKEFLSLLEQDFE